VTAVVAASWEVSTAMPGVIAAPRITDVVGGTVVVLRLTVRLSVLELVGVFLKVGM
jgi:hypothetical protein